MDLAQRYKDGTTTEVETEQLREDARQAVKATGNIVNKPWHRLYVGKDTPNRADGSVKGLAAGETCAILNADRGCKYANASEEYRHGGFL